MIIAIIYFLLVLTTISVLAQALNKWAEKRKNK